MLMIGILSTFIFLISSFIVVIDMFKKHTAIGCFGLLLLPLLPLFWVIRKYSGNRLKMGAVLYGSLILSVSLIGYQWNSISNDIEPFINSASTQGIELSLKTIGTSGENKQATLIANKIYEPKSPYTSVEELLQVIQKEKIENLAAIYPKNLKNFIIIVALPTKSGFIAVYEIDAPSSISESYSSTYDDL